MTKVEFKTTIDGLEFHDTYSLYPCRHVHHKWAIDGKGPKRARRIKMSSVAMKRLKAVMEVVG